MTLVLKNSNFTNIRVFKTLFSPTDEAEKYNCKLCRMRKHRQYHHVHYTNTEMPVEQHGERRLDEETSLLKRR